MRIGDAGRLIRLESGTVDPARLTLFSTMKNERDLLPAWLDHHRSIGFQQFLVWDDASDDGTFEYLCTQPDCAVMRADLSFGQAVRYTDPDGVTRTERAGTYFKVAVPHLFFDGAHVGYLDADEFLILPPGVDSVSEVVAWLRAEEAPAVAASVVEFSPAAADGLTGTLPQSFDGLMGAYPYFEAEPLVRLVPGAQPDMVGPSKTARLHARYGTVPPLIRRGWHRLWLPRAARRAQLSQTSPRLKTPILLRNATSWQVGSHRGNAPPSSEILLTVAHFVFTAQLRAKIDRAIAVGAHAHGARKYHGYRMLLDAMGARADGFLGPNAVRFENAKQFLRCGLMRWPGADQPSKR